MVLVATRNPLNIGAVARAMSDFGVFHLRVVRPYEAAFRAARSAVGAENLLARAEEYETVPQAIADCGLVVGTTALGTRELQHPMRRLEEGARLIRRRLGPAKIALLFGSEKVGLSNNDLSYCHWLMRIPTRTEHRSMNLGQSVAICLYELIRNCNLSAATPTPEKQIAKADQVERLTSALFDILVKPATGIQGQGRRPKKKCGDWCAGFALMQPMPRSFWECCGRCGWKLRTQGPARD